ncbi:MAG: hypothetical protein ACTSUT_20710 [Promethearchaeota archaeon]
MNCEYCKKPMTRTRVKHINICQPEPVHIFCSKECKNKWCFEIQNGKKTSTK